MEIQQTGGKFTTKFKTNCVKYKLFLPPPQDNFGPTKLLFGIRKEPEKYKLSRKHVFVIKIVKIV